MAHEPIVRTHVVMPKAMVDKIDRLVGARRRSRFINEAVARELAHLELVEAAASAIGSARGQTRPWGDTPESIAQWVHDDRQASIERDDALEALRANPEPARP